MRFLRDKDYLKQIQDDNFLQVIESDQSIRLDMELAAQAEITSYLAQRYDIASIFTNTQSFEIGDTYFGKNLVEYSADDYDAAATYSADDRVVYNGDIYKSIAGNTAEAFDPAKWTFIAVDKSLFYAKTPEPEYVHSATYTIGDTVWYKDATYTATAETTGNLPTDSNFWDFVANYSFSGDYPDDTSKWTQGDNRNQQIVLIFVDIVLFHVHSRINPRNIPDLRKQRYNGDDPTDRGGALGWLKKVGAGDLTADLPSIIPEQGISISYGSTEARTNMPDNW